MTNAIIKLLDWMDIKGITKFYVAELLDMRLCAQIKSIVSKKNNLPYSNNNSHNKKVLFFTVQGRPNMLPVIEGLLAHSLNSRGAYSEMIICDRILPVCDLPFVTTSDAELLCKACGTAAKRIYSSFKLPYHFFSQFINQHQINKAEEIVDSIKFEDYFGFEYLGVDIGKHVYSSVLRYLLKGSIGNDNFTKSICREYMKSAIIMAQISKKIIEELRPDSVVMHHGIYCTTGIFAEYAKKQGIHIVVFTPAYRKNTYLFSHNDTYHRTLQDESIDNWENLSFSEQHRKMLDGYLDSRRWGSQDFISYHPNPLESKLKIIKELGLNVSKKTVGLFTNLSWDGQVVFHDTAFSSMVEWIMETISFFIKRPDLQLVIRIHPAEVKSTVETQQKLYPLIRDKFPDLPDNIKVVDSRSDISTYTLSELVSTALVYTTKVGLEFAIKGIPVIVGGEAFYRGKGFTYDADSKAEYFSLLDNLSNLKKNSPELIEKARKYAYYYFFRRFIPFNYTINRTWNNVVGINIKNLDELRSGRNKYLDLICAGILENKPFVIDTSEI
ncbi:MAG: hypothetical protein WC496_04220 [Phycisphaerae bacterium]|jgi:hypothetical protein